MKLKHKVVRICGVGLVSLLPVVAHAQVLSGSDPIAAASGWATSEIPVLAAALVVILGICVAFRVFGLGRKAINKAG